jgi:hypothetical protein
MKKLLSCVLGLAALAYRAEAKEACPTNKYPPPYPWYIVGVMSGDQFADIFLDLDKAGKPVRCRMGRTNIPGDDRFFVCNAFLEQFSTATPGNDPASVPSPANLPANSPIKSTIYRKYVAYGEKHAKAEHDARTQFFKLHPEERPECYPD